MPVVYVSLNLAVSAMPFTSIDNKLRNDLNIVTDPGLL